MQKPLKILLLVFLSYGLSAQTSSLRSVYVDLKSTTQVADSLTIVPGSIDISDSAGRMYDSSFYHLDNNRISLVLSKFLESGAEQILLVRYRVLPFNLRRPFTRIDTANLIRESGDRIIGLKYDPYAAQPQPFFPREGLDYNGTFSRGLSFGNNQSLVLNSQFNLQMAGTLGDLDVLAAITDNNIPLQAEGNTQQLREFDKVFIQISRKNSRLVAGDYELESPRGYFMKYYKKLQGVTFNNQIVPGTGKLSITSRGSAAIARGKYGRNVLQVQEGNQGPYRLQGMEGERFIIILSGTERVYLNGQQLVRGLEHDYVIDYNAGHVTFTNRRLINKDSRIIVEFDYADQNFQRSLYALNTILKGEDFDFYLNTYSEQDSRKPVDSDFSQEEMEVLRNAGDANQEALINSITQVEEFSAFRILYRSVDTLVNGIFHRNVLVFADDKASAKYSAGFTNVGKSNGNYILETQTAANGRVYRWVAPDANGKPNGEYEPVRRLIAPKVQQLYTVGGSYNLAGHTKLKAEVALSNTDQNRLSKLGDSDNEGIAVRAGLRQVFPLGKRPEKNENDSGRTESASGFPEAAAWQIETEADYEFVQHNFRELNPYRNTEFTRDWNLSQNPNDVSLLLRKGNEHLATASASLKTPDAGLLSYRFSTLLRDTSYNGFRHFTKYTYQNKGFEVWASSDLLNSSGITNNSRYFKPRFFVSVPVFRDSSSLKHWKVGLSGEREKNERFLKSNATTADTLHNASLFFDILEGFVERQGIESFFFRANAIRRIDYFPRGTEFEKGTLANEMSLQGFWQQSRSSRLSWNFTLRELTVRDKHLSKVQPASTYAGRLDHNLTVLKGLLQSGTSYEIGSGQERKVEFTYLEVPKGEGSHQWEDRNEDGIVQVDEIEIAAFQDLANAIRITVYTDDFIRTNNVQFNQSLRLEPRVMWFNSEGLKKFISRFSTQSTLLVSRRVVDTEGVNGWNPFQLQVADTALVASRSSLYNTLFFNRADIKYEIQAGISDNENKVVLTTGYESRRQKEYFLRFRWNILKTLSLSGSISQGLDYQGSEQFESKRYRISSIETLPQLTYQPSGYFRTNLGWRYRKGKNELESSGESVELHDIKMEAQYNQSSTMSIRAMLSLVNINFQGQVNSPVGFAFLQGLQDGRNFIWNLSLDRQVAKNIRMSISYEGRKTGASGLVHVGRAQMAAVF